MTGTFHFAGLVLAGIRDNRMLWMLIAGFALFPLFTHIADLPFWNDVAMRIMLLGMAAMGLNLVLGYGGMVSFGHAAFMRHWRLLCWHKPVFWHKSNGLLHIVLSIGVCGCLGW